jgi:hypothetical protein
MANVDRTAILVEFPSINGAEEIGIRLYIHVFNTPGIHFYRCKHETLLNYQNWIAVGNSGGLMK